MIGELTPEQIENIIQSQSVCRLACILNNEPYVVPISYYYDGSFFYCQSEEGKKIDAMRNNPKVCMQIDLINGMNNWQSVVVYGEYEELKNWKAEKARKDMFEKIFSMLTRSSTHPFEHDKSQMLDDSNREKKMMFRIQILQKTGRFEKQQ
jgi:nitroimidazol reductase NimA-like FMN-containing flavoprotein (pyridoxamine 5'-phosphate oxidase superfamily)